MYNATYTSLPFGPSQLLAEAATVYAIAAQRMSHIPALRAMRRTASDGLTVLLFAVSVLGTIQLVHMVSEANTPTPSVSPSRAPSAATIATQPVSQAPSLPASVPTHIQIPSINLDASVDTVGLNNDGSLAVPYREDVGWYNGSPTPGEIGPSIIDGHVDSVYGIAVFWYLRNVKPGDKVLISRQDGGTVTFSVDKVAAYDQHNFPTNQVYGNIKYAGLRLITCDGTFDYTTRHYSNNLVVYAHANL